MSIQDTASPLVGVIMGSLSDWEIMQHCAARLTELQIPFEKRIVSAHRTPHLVHEYAETAEARGIRIIIAAAGGSAHLPGMTAAHTHLPVIGCPMPGWSVDGLDSLLSIVNMPGGIPVNTMGIGKPGAINAALSATAILALGDSAIRERLIAFRTAQTEAVLKTELP
ncbi:MAG: 5-(carboxyamino)imidazole ribonucleotide mutase [Verrucomicrobiota bacterium]|nr:5-(carboxyamino)imidazole ribonucleotide mutase [Verrucomicrobiota bacterium]